MSAVVKHDCMSPSALRVISRARNRGRTRAQYHPGMDSTIAFGSALTSERGRLPIVPSGPVGKPAPTISYLKEGFLGHLILRGLGYGFGYLRFALRRHSSHEATVAVLL